MLVIGQKRCINLREVFMYELSPVPFSLFDQYGDMLSGTKSTLTHRLAQYIPNTDTPNLVIVDGIELIYHVVWPQNGTVHTLCESMVSRVADVNIVDDVYIVFDRYKTGSIKEHERVRRTKGMPPPTTSWHWLQCYQLETSSWKTHWTNNSLPIYYACAMYHILSICLGMSTTYMIMRKQMYQWLAMPTNLQKKAKRKYRPLQMTLMFLCC